MAQPPAAQQLLAELRDLGVEAVSAQQLEQQLEEHADRELHRHAVYGDRRVVQLQNELNQVLSETQKLRAAMESLDQDPDLQQELVRAISKKSLTANKLEGQLARLIAANEKRHHVRTSVENAVNLDMGDALSSAMALNRNFQADIGYPDDVRPAKRPKYRESDLEEQDVDIVGTSESDSSGEDLLEEEALLQVDADDDDTDTMDSPANATSSPGKGFVDDYDDAKFMQRLAEVAVAEQFSEVPRTSIAGAFSMRKNLYDQLFEHQQLCVRWLWELHQLRCGGIVGDEMGLGKTLEVIAFLDGLYSSGLGQSRPSLVVCPATVVRQWLREWHTWAPSFRILVYHPTFRSSLGQNSEQYLRNVLRKCRDVSRTGAVIVITTYDMVRSHSQYLVSSTTPTDTSVPAWHYAILDEGHKLRNPNSRISTICKQFKTPHRLLLTGAPIQNNLTELWSLFDFIFEGKLGTQESFDLNFAQPIMRGGYASSTAFEARVAHKCAVALRDIIKPYLLRRLKKDVKIMLPHKNEQVLFCRLTPAQRLEYTRFLSSQDAKMVLSGKKNMLFGVDVLRKICNHVFLLADDKGQSRLRLLPDTLVAYSATNAPPEVDTSSISSYLASFSSKLKVVQHILQLWRREGNHKVLLFCQTRQMLDIVEFFIKDLNYRYLRMDGNTSVQRRAVLIDEFNSGASNTFIFLLTTRVGGLGVNLTSADKVLIFDPDWNPVTDLQARERSYRIGQTRDVTIYRLVTLGTIEEKIYQRQIFKQFLTNRILKNPAQNRALFKASDLKDLFKLDDTDRNALKDASASTEAAVAALNVPATSTPADDRANSSADDDPLLQELIGSDLHSRLNHDHVLGDSDAGRAQEKLYDEEASRLAEAAVARFRASRLNRAVEETTAQHWQGFGRFGKKSRAASVVSSNSEHEAERPQHSGSVLQSIKTASSVTMSAHEQDLLLRDLHGYLDRSGGEAKSHELIEAFQHRVRGADSVRIFKKLLKQIANLDKKQSVWRLKEI